MGNAQHDELIPIIDRVAKLQRALKLTDRALVRKYPELGSAKTWRERLLPHTFDGLKLDRIAPRLRQLAAQLDGGTPLEKFFDDLPFVRQANDHLDLLLAQRNDRRVLVILAPTGVGKSSWARHAVDQDRATRVYVRCRPSWREKKVHLCAGIAKALGEAPASSGEADAEDKVIDLLRANPRTVFLDEAHDGGVALMKLIRTFVDETQARFVYLAYPTEFDRVRTATMGSIVEAQQFIGRCVKPICDQYRLGTKVDDVAKYLSHETELNGESRAVAREILPLISRGYNLRLLDDALAELAASDDDWDAAALLQVVRDLGGESHTATIIKE